MADSKTKSEKDTAAQADSSTSSKKDAEKKPAASKKTSKTKPKKEPTELEKAREKFLANWKGKPVADCPRMPGTVIVKAESDEGDAPRLVVDYRPDA